MSSTENKVYLETFGCQMNVSDSERVRTTLSAAGYRIVTSEDDADVVLFNTCSVRERAEQKLFTRVGEIRARQNFEQPLIGVLGCVAQLEGETLLAKSRKIDFVVGTEATGRVAGLITKAVKEKKANQKLFDLDEREDGYQWLVSPEHRQSKYVAFVPIIEGCNKFCTYCIVPFSRGRERSRPADEILREVRRLSIEGVREIHLIGQNVNSYRPRILTGLEQFSGATPFVKLLRAVAETGIERIKFTTSFPRDFTSDIVSAINEYKNLCNWIHLPVQSGSDRILRLMRRGHLIETYRRHVEIIKSSARSIALTSDFIVGFPGETEADFAETLRLVEESDFDSLYIFKYSPRPGTPAAALQDDVTRTEKQSRFLALERVQRANQRKKFAGYCGRIVDVLAENVSSKYETDLTGHTTCHKVVNFTAPLSRLGRELRVEIIEAKTNTLYGVVVEN